MTPVRKTARAARSTRRPAPRRASGDVFVALADPTRRRLLELLRTGEQPVHRLATRFRVTRPAISQHLRVLRDADLVTETRAGRERVYRLHARALRQVFHWVKQYEAFWDDRLDHLGDVLDTEAARERHSS